MVHRLTPEHEALLARIVAADDRLDADGVIEDALRLFEERLTSLQWLRSDIAIADDQALRGQLIDFDRNRLDDLKARASEGARHGKQIRDAVKP